MAGKQIEPSARTIKVVGEPQEYVPDRIREASTEPPQWGTVTDKPPRRALLGDTFSPLIYNGYSLFKGDRE